MPQLAAFPKAWMDELSVTGAMSLQDWIELSSQLDVDGLEFYAGMLDLADPLRWREHLRMVEDQGRSIPMLCCSPDFTHEDASFRSIEVDREKRWIDMAAALDAPFCRVLSGQRRPEFSVKEGLKFAADCIVECLEHAKGCGVSLVIENHYKDNYWTYPEFAQHADVFCALVDMIDGDAWPNFGVNYDPSNTILAGEDPLELLARVKHRVMTMHASDRYLTEGTIEDLQREENVEGYAARLRHGEIGRGLNDYDAIFSTLRDVGFDSWISIEDGVDGMEQMAASCTFLRQKIAAHWPEPANR